MSNLRKGFYPGRKDALSGRCCRRAMVGVGTRRIPSSQGPQDPALTSCGY